MADNMVTLKLSGPVSAEQAKRMNAKEVKNYSRPGMEITVPRVSAEALIDAGYGAGVDPNDKAAVNKALSRVEPSEPAPAAPAARAEPVKTSKTAKS